MDEEDHARQSESNVDVTLCRSNVYQSIPSADKTQPQVFSLREPTTTAQNEARHKTAVALFNADPADGVRFMVDRELFSPRGSTAALLKHLVACPMIDRAMLGKYVTQSGFWEEFVLLFDFMHRTLDCALRSLLSAVVLPPLEGRKKAVSAFVDQYCFHNDHHELLSDPVIVFPVVTLLLKLNDALGPKAPARAEFLDWCKVALESIRPDSFAEPTEFVQMERLLIGMYKRVREKGFAVDPTRWTGCSFTLDRFKSVKTFSIDDFDRRGWLWLSEHISDRDSRIQDTTWSRYYVVLSDWVLYVFHDVPESTLYGSGSPYCIIPLLDSYPMHGRDVDSLMIFSDNGMRVFHPSSKGRGVVSAKVIHVKADDIETLDGWYQTLRSKHIHPSARATAEFSQYLEAIKSKAMSPNSLKRALKWPRALSPNTDTLIFRVIPPDALQGYVLLRRKSQQYAYKKFCVLIERKIYYATDKQDCKKDSKFKGYVDLSDIQTLDSTVSKGAWKYVIHLKDQASARICNLGLPSAKEFSIWLRTLTELCGNTTRASIPPPATQVPTPEGQPPLQRNHTEQAGLNGRNGFASITDPAPFARTTSSPVTKPVIKPPVPPPMAPAEHMKAVSQGSVPVPVPVPAPVPPSIPPPMVPPS